MRLTFSITGKTFTAAGASSVPEEECFAALKVDHARRIWPDHGETKQVWVDLNTEQAQALVEQLQRDYPYLFEHSKKVEA